MIHVFLIISHVISSLSSNCTRLEISQHFASSPHLIPRPCSSIRSRFFGAITFVRLLSSSSSSMKNPLLSSTFALSQFLYSILDGPSDVFFFLPFHDLCIFSLRLHQAAIPSRCGGAFAKLNFTMIIDGILVAANGPASSISLLIMHHVPRIQYNSRLPSPWE